MKIIPLAKRKECLSNRRVEHPSPLVLVGQFSKEGIKCIEDRLVIIELTSKIPKHGEGSSQAPED